ncbi:hypothetical protein R2G56_08590 [Nitratireductor aquimarinus]|uniref:Tail fiber protein n=1 Tax=Nitratireductor aquimarinus TaxID=889300 RepID=A0ABU4AJE9_9HYPH|nr:hypothetical protein [Nitratireductor aquimarinus]MDV6226340.1 hypothetical protein [Nitratireductor aquimarinus]
MPVENTTPNRNYSLPFRENELRDDVARIISAISGVDLDVANILSGLNSKSDDDHGHVISDVTGLLAALASKQDADQKGLANGFASLGSDGKVPSGQLPSAVFGALSYQGTWNANTNTPTIPAASASNKGWYFKVSTSGTTSIGGIDDWKNGDWIVSNGTSWDKVDNTETVVSVAGLVGAIDAAALLNAIAAQPRVESVNVLELTRDKSGDRVSHIDFHATDDPSQADFSARLIRREGINGYFRLEQKGSGPVEVVGGSDFTRDGHTVYHAGNVSGVFATAAQGAKADAALPKSGGSLTGSLAVSTHLNIQGSGNQHLWFRDAAGTTQGLMYWDSANDRIAIRTYADDGFSVRSEIKLGGDATSFDFNGQDVIHAGHPASAKAWVNFNGTGSVSIRASFGVTSISDMGTGHYRVNLSSAAPSTESYAAVAMSEHGGDRIPVTTYQPTHFDVLSGSGDAARMNVLVFGGK